MWVPINDSNPSSEVLFFKLSGYYEKTIGIEAAWLSLSVTNSQSKVIKDDANQKYQPIWVDPTAVVDQDFGPIWVGSKSKLKFNNGSKD